MTILDSRLPDLDDEAAFRPAAPAQPGRDPIARLEALFDPGSLRLLLPPDASGVLTAEGLIDLMPAVAFASDPRVQGGAMGSEGCAAIVAAYDRALELGSPVLGLWHSGGARLREGVESLHAVGTVFAAMTRASGKVPQISVVLGPAAGGAAYGPALTDLVILSDQGRIFVTGPDVVRSVTGAESTWERLGGPEPHGRRSGVHVVTPTDSEALGKRGPSLLLGSQRRRGGQDPGRGRHRLARYCLESPKRVRRASADQQGARRPGVELHPRWPNVTTLSTGGRTVGGQPRRLGAA